MVAALTRLRSLTPALNPLAGLVGLQYIPPAEVFLPAVVDIYTGNGGFPVPGPKRKSGVSCLITGSWMAGHRAMLASTTDPYTHVMLLDANVEIRDAYKGNGQALGTAPDAVVVTGEASTNSVGPWRFVVFSFVTNVPGIGRRKVVLLDQRSSYASTTFLKDTFTDTAGVTLGNHVMDVGPGWTQLTGTMTISTGQQAQSTVNPSRYVSDAGNADFTASLLISSTKVTTKSGLALRTLDASNGIEVRLTTTVLEIVSRVAGVETVLASTVLALGANSAHTINAWAQGTTLTANVDGGNQISTTSSVQQTTTTHGIVELYDGTNVPLVDNLNVSTYTTPPAVGNPGQLDFSDSANSMFVPTMGSWL